MQRCNAHAAKCALQTRNPGIVVDVGGSPAQLRYHGGLVGTDHAGDGVGNDGHRQVRTCAVHMHAHCCCLLVAFAGLCRDVQYLPSSATCHDP